MQEKIKERKEIIEVELVLSQIERVILQNADTENYEDCARLKKIKVSLNLYLKNKLTFEEIKEDLLFGKQKFGAVMIDVMNKAEQQRNKK